MTRVAYPRARISQNVSPPFFGGRAATTSRARSIASTRIAISGRPAPSRVKFGDRLGHDLRITDRQTRPLNKQVCGSDHDASDERKDAGKQHEVDNKSGHLLRSPIARSLVHPLCRPPLKLGRTVTVAVQILAILAAFVGA